QRDRQAASVASRHIRAEAEQQLVAARDLADAVSESLASPHVLVTCGDRLLLGHRQSASRARPPSALALASRVEHAPRHETGTHLRAGATTTATTTGRPAQASARPGMSP